MARRNGWESLEPPLCDLFVQEIVPKYLDIEDLAHLSAVARRYHELFGKNRPTAKQLLKGLLLRDSRQQHCHHNNASASLSYREGLPSLGNTSLEQSLDQDPWLVYRLRQPALRRRRLLLLDSPASNEAANLMQELVAQHSASIVNNRVVRALASDPLVQHRYNGAMLTVREATQFLCWNESGVDVYCHWIDRSGSLLVRDGDRIPSSLHVEEGNIANDPLRHRSFVVNNRGMGQPPHVFCHQSYTHHSFALCFQEGGPPFAIYQQRRGWNPFVAGRNRFQHTHAIVVASASGLIRELHCDMRVSGADVPRARIETHYHVMDREHSASFALDLNEGGAVVENNNNNNPSDTAAMDFYGFQVPSIEQEHGGWTRSGRILAGPDRLFQQVEGEDVAHLHPVNAVSFVSEAVTWFLFVRQQQQQNNDDDESGDEIAE